MADGTAWQRDSAQHFDLDLSRLALLNQSTSHIRKNGSLSNRRQEAEEEVVQGQGYAISNLFHPPRAPHTHMNDHRNAHANPSNERNEQTSTHDVNRDKR